jgi:hypothetical protein
MGAYKMAVQIHYLDNHVFTDENTVAAFEHQLNIILPADYRNFLLTHNGGYPKPNHFWIPNHPFPNQRSDLNIFLGFCPGSVYDIIITYDVYKGRMPEELIPIADDPGGNVICLAIKGENTGKIYFWYHEDEGETPSYENVS